jgi:hypothetical protein
MFRSGAEFEHGRIGDIKIVIRDLGFGYAIGFQAS